jgi:hypothetical protein
MRIVLAIVSIAIAAPLLFIGIAVTYNFVADLSDPAMGVTFEGLWPELAFLVGIILVGVLFLIADIAVLTTKPRVKQLAAASVHLWP